MKNNLPSYRNLLIYPCFAACIIYKELERQLRANNSNLSPEKIIDIAKTIFQITIVTTYSKTRYRRMVVNKAERLNRGKHYIYSTFILGDPAPKSGGFTRMDEFTQCRFCVSIK